MRLKGHGLERVAGSLLHLKEGVLQRQVLARVRLAHVLLLTVQILLATFLLHEVLH